MTAKGHVLLALPFALLASNVMNINHIETMVFTSTVVAGALFPDIDEPGSYIGRKLWFLAWPIKILAQFIPMFRHRGATHFLIIPLMLMLLSYFIENIMLTAFAVGWIAHTVGDMLTVTGIRGYFYPILPDARIRLLPEPIAFQTGGIIEGLLIFGLIFINGFLYKHELLLF